MLYEVRIQEVNDPDKRDEYVAVYKQALRQANLPGCHGGQIMKCVEEPNKVLVMIAWDSVEAHRAANKTEAFAKFRDAYMPYRNGQGTGGHYVPEEL